MGLRPVYNILSKLENILKAAKDLINLGDVSDDRKAEVLLTNACNLSLTIAPEAKIPLLLTMSIDTALAKQEEDACEKAGVGASKALTGALTKLFDALDDQNTQFTTSEAAKYAAAIGFMEKGNVQKTEILDASIIGSYATYHPYVSISGKTITVSIADTEITLSDKFKIKSIVKTNNDGSQLIREFDSDGQYTTSYDPSGGTTQAVTYNYSGSAFTSVDSTPGADVGQEILDGSVTISGITNNYTGQVSYSEANSSYQNYQMSDPPSINVTNWNFDSLGEQMDQSNGNLNDLYLTLKNGVITDWQIDAVSPANSGSYPLPQPNFSISTGDLFEGTFTGNFQDAAQKQNNPSGGSYDQVYAGNNLKGSWSIG